MQEMTEIEYLNFLLGPTALGARDRSRAVQEALLDDVPEECFLVGQSFCIKYGLPRYHLFDGLVHIGATRADYKWLRRKYPEYRIHIVEDYTAIEALKCLCGDDNPISLKCTFDRALKKRLVTFEEVDALLETSFRGKEILARIRAFLYDKFDSPLESMTHIFFNLHGFREPEKQVEVGENRCDFMCRGVIYEGEGDIKYSGELEGVDPVAQMNREHERNNNYHLHGFPFYHYKWRHLWDGTFLKLLQDTGYPRAKGGPYFKFAIRKYRQRQRILEKKRNRYRSRAKKQGG
jgi:hypothetical protein